MKAVCFFTKKSFFLLKEEQSQWKLSEQAVDQEFVSCAYDQKAKRMYAGSFDAGLWVSENEGRSWRGLAEERLPKRIMSLAVSPHDEGEDFQVLYVGSEPSALYRSKDGGNSWQDFPSLLELPSQSSWSFPPRPHTHHVKAIQVDLHNRERLFAGIELGGVMKSSDQGETWEDRKPGSQYDVHSLTMVSTQADRLYEAGGGGFAQSYDGGANWQTENNGLGDYTYLVNIAVNNADPDTLLASAAKSARYAYQPSKAESVLVRKEGDQPWKIIQTGLPQADGSTVFHLMADPQKADSFYALNNKGFFYSKDGGLSWSELVNPWPEKLKRERIHTGSLVEL